MKSPYTSYMWPAVGVHIIQILYRPWHQVPVTQTLEARPLALYLHCYWCTQAPSLDSPRSHNPRQCPCKRHLAPQDWPQRCGPASPPSAASECLRAAAAACMPGRTCTVQGLMSHISQLVWSHLHMFLQAASICSSDSPTSQSCRTCVMC